MGDRVRVCFHEGRKNFSPVVYQHWAGPCVARNLVECGRRSCWTRDADQACAWFIAEATEGYSADQIGTIRVSRCVLGSEDDEILDKLTSDKFSPGDAGVVLVDVLTWRAEAFNGYGFVDNYENGKEVMIFDVINNKGIDNEIRPNA